MPHCRAQNPGSGVRLLFALGLGTAIASAAHARSSGGGSLPNYGFQWSTVGSPGNAPTNVPTGSVVPPFSVEVGRVDYSYRMMTTEVTVGQWYDFVRAYAPFVDSVGAASREFYGMAGITFNGFSNGVPQYTLNESRRDRPVAAGWRYGARLANYLHNGAPDTAHATAADFENGAYDASTFATVPTPGKANHITDQAERSPGAKFFFPTWDEWAKAGYYDPNRYGPGQEGWWLYPISSDTAPIPDSPEFGGQTNYGVFPAGHPRPLDVGSYPNATSPWGLLDMSGGGGSEWLENLRFFQTGSMGPLPNGRWVIGTGAGGISSPLLDQLRIPPYDFPSGWNTIRLGSVVPSPSVYLAVCFPALLSLPLRRRRPCDSHSRSRPPH